VKKTRWLGTIVFLFTLAFLLFERASVRSVTARSESPKNIYLLEAVTRLIRNDYLEEKDPLKIMTGSFKGLVNSLDSYSGYLDAESTARYEAQRGSPLFSPGIVFFKKFGAFPQIVGLIEGSPAEKSELKAGDLITEVDEKSTVEMSRPELDLWLNALEPSPVRLKILREEKTLNFQVARAPFSPQPWMFLEQQGMSGILKISRLETPCVDGIKAELVARLQKSARPLIIDLRNCDRGAMEEAGRLINLFLQAETIGYFVKKGGEKEFLSAPEEAALAKIPLAVWVNPATIGPAEVVAAVLRDFKRAKIIGFPTVGLVARRDYISLGDGTSILLTSGVFHLREGTILWERGAEVDTKLDPSDQDFAAYLKRTQELFSTS